MISSFRTGDFQNTGQALSAHRYIQFIHSERLKQHADVTLTLCGYLPCRKLPTTARLPVSVPDMRNTQLKPGYNVQIAVDSEYIVATDIFQDRNDVWTLIPFLQRMEEKLGFRYPIVMADSGYENILSEEEILYRMNRSIQVEGVFGVLKNDYEFQRFLLRGKTTIKLKILLFSMGYNFNKLHAKIQKNRTGRHLFPVQECA